MANTIQDFISYALQSKAWPFLEAEKILKKINYTLPTKGYVLFETGYGPSGLPHIGTFGEVVRTTMVRRAFEQISQMPTKLFCISDDMDGMRKIPDTIPNPAEYKKYLDLPLTAVPDPFGTHESFGHHMNAKLREFLDHFSFEYEFRSATECYRNGLFNQSLLKALKYYDQIMEVMLPTLGEERRGTYSPFLPICQKSGKVLQVPTISRDLSKGTITYRDLEGEVVSSPVTDGHCKMQWKPDFGMRWAAFDVDFEMYGKDHLVNGPIYTRICEILKGKAPEQMFYELFLDEGGQKISKSKGNGLTIDEWLHYAPPESLSLFMYLTPQKAKKLHLDVIPKHVDEYLIYLDQYHREEDLPKKLANPVCHIHAGSVPSAPGQISYSLLLNLLSACNTDNYNTILRYITKFNPLTPLESPLLKQMIQGAINYYSTFVKPKRSFRSPNLQEAAALTELLAALEALEGTATADSIQNKIYEIGKNNGFELKAWFNALYQILLGRSEGPRMGSFISLYGIPATIELIQKALGRPS